MATILIDADLIEINMDVSTKEDALLSLSNRLLEKDLVEQGFYQHIIEREEQFPTGLPTSIPIALCHTEAIHVKKSALAVATLKRPVIFQEMGTPEKTLDVEIIFLLALKDPKDQVHWLKKMIGVFQKEEALHKIRSASSPNELSLYLSQVLGDPVIETKDSQS
ncbi:MAG: PTS fructose transporter subunit IIA [Anaerolineae bacterium]|jgi:PTS system galactitol-specific IIA component|nr:MAG: PTS fructose transporter subunit IIA [Anaerolineae bacterium]